MNPTLKTIGYTLLGVALFTAVYLTGITLRTQRYESTCLSNLQKVGRGILMYEQDNDATFPPMAAWWNKQAGKYEGCPAYKPFVPGADHPLMHPVPQPIPGYAPNSEFGDRPITLKSIIYPHYAVLVFEADPQNPDGARRRHSEAANYLFVDGHAESIFPKDMHFHVDDTHLMPKMVEPDFYVHW